jgi:hypothetical protein
MKDIIELTLTAICLAIGVIGLALLGAIRDYRRVINKGRDYCD